MTAGGAGGSRLAPSLVAAYRAARYEVSGARPPFVLRVDEPSAALAECHRGHAVRESAFLTAWNPGSVRLPPAVNAAAAARLEARLLALGFRLLAGCAVDPAGAWQAEPSALVLGIGYREACDVAREYGQAGVLHAGADAVPRLVLLE